jgi:uncharacterized protein YndB with AHSA1/START domain
MIDGVDEAEEPTQLRLHLEKNLAASPEHVFAAFEAERLRHWWGPAGFAVPHLQFEPAEGSEYRIAMQPPDGDVFHVHGTFCAVEVPRRLRFTFNYEEPDPDDRETLVTLTLEPTNDGTRVSLDQGPFRTVARLDLHREG